MDTKSVIAFVDQLEEDLEDLEDKLEPLLTNALTNTTQKLPLLDRAKLNVLLVYAIESLIFSYLRLHGVQAKDHPVFRELTRVKQYFAKIKDAESEPTQSHPNLALDKDAAGRMIKHALSGNDKYDLERREREAREKLLAKRKLMNLETIMKEKAMVKAQQEAQAEATALAAAQEAAQLIATDVDMEEGEISDDSISASTSSSDNNDEGILGMPDEYSNASSGVLNNKPDDVEQQTISEQPPQETTSSQSGKKGKKRKQTSATEAQETKRQKNTANKQRKKARKDALAATANTNVPKAATKKQKKTKKAKKAKSSATSG